MAHGDVREGTPVGIERVTLRFVAQHLNRCATPVPVQWIGGWVNPRCFGEEKEFFAPAEN